MENLMRYINGLQDLATRMIKYNEHLDVAIEEFKLWCNLIGADEVKALKIVSDLCENRGKDVETAIEIVKTRIMSDLNRKAGN